MKNGIALKGHRRIVISIGAADLARRPPSGGWYLSCLCGWSGGVHRIRLLAQIAYRAHIDDQLTNGLFRCKRCGTEKPLSEMRSDYRYVCKPCFSKIGNEWQKRNPEQAARHRRNHHLLRTFGITIDEADSLLAEQGGLCAICREPIGREPHVDHDHRTGAVRGILCFSCNVGLGVFGDDPARLLAAVQYLGIGSVS